MDRFTTPGADAGRPAARLPGASPEELARLAYGVLDNLDFLEMNDGNRLGYHIYLYLAGEIPTIAEAIYEAKSRTSIDPVRMEAIIAERLRLAGAAS